MSAVPMTGWMTTSTKEKQMAEHNPESALPVRRGRRDPELATQLGLDNDQTEVGVSDDDEYELPLMIEGDVMAGKVTLDLVIDGRSQWVTAEVRTRIYPGETAEGAAARVGTVIQASLEERIHEAEEVIVERARSQSRRRITPN